MKQATIKVIEIFLGKLGEHTLIDVTGCVKVENIDISDAYQSIYDMIDDNGGFSIDIICYSNAIEYLKQNDPSLHECMAIADEYGFQLKSLNSEILASLLASSIALENFSRFKDEINEFFETLETEEDSE